MFCLTALLPILAFPACPAQETYRLPPPEVVAIVDAPVAPGLVPSPDGRWLLMVERGANPTIADLSRRMLRLAGMRIDPAANARHRTSFNTGLVVRDLEGATSTRVPLPEGARVAGTSWSHTSNYFAYTLATDSGTHLYAAPVDEPDKPILLTDALNGIFGGFEWMPDGEQILCQLVPLKRGREPLAPTVPAGPNIQESGGDKSPLRTYQDLLKNAHDEALFEYYATAELALVSARTGNTIVVATPAIYSSVQPSPDGRHLLVTRTERPFSRLMPVYLFPQTIAVWELTEDFAITRERVIARVPVGENIPIEGVRTGPRSVRWKPGAGASLVWVEALDGGDPKRKAEHRDRWLTVADAFEDEPREMLRTQHRAQGLSFFEDPSLVIAREYDRDERWQRSILHDLSGEAESRVIEDRSSRDRYGDPGAIARRTDATGSSIILQRGPWIYRTGRGASPEGLLPFLDRQNIETLETERLWRCEPGAYEAVVELIEGGSPESPIFLTRHETPESPPNYFLRGRGDDAVALTQFPDPQPGMRGVTQRLVTYERGDGVSLSATLYLPAGYREGTRLPLVVWAYPREFNDPETASQVSSTPWNFTTVRPTSHLTLLTQGYAIMDGATMPIIGDPETMNDTFIEQLVAAGAAAIDKAVEMGVADRTRVAVGGHSYGAFMTANLLAHCDLFHAGIARSGAYNRTLTPFGFQAERRTIWEAPEIYFSISPFLHADGINEPLLMIHGEDDNNSGTFPVQSRRMFQAIKGHGGKARLVMLPNESHGYRARESVLHVQAEMIEWLDRHLELPLIEAGFNEDR